MEPDNSIPQGKDMHVAVAVDAQFVVPLAVTLRSLARTHVPGELTVHVLHDGIPAGDMRRIEQGLDNAIDVEWRELDTSALEGAHHTPTLTHATLFRLLLPEVLPPSLEKVIYLDADIVVARSLRPLWEFEIEGRPIGAVRDADMQFAVGPLGTDWRALGLAPDVPYFNAGVLVISLEAWRREGISEQALEVLKGSKPRWGDQDALNVVLQSRWTELGCEWNLQTPNVIGNGLGWALWREEVEAAIANPAVIHYSSTDKPWNPDSRHPLADLWSEVLDETEWAGWRLARPSVLRRAAGRVKRAGRVLATGQT